MKNLDSVPVLDKGYVRLREVHGDDLLVVNAARVSFNKRSEWNISFDNDTIRTIFKNTPLRFLMEKEATRKIILDNCDHVKYLSAKDLNLLMYLARHKHWSPFSHPYLTFELKVPVMVVNQLYKHRVGSRFTEDSNPETFDDGWNEMSGRYVSEDFEFYLPDSSSWRSAPDNKKQGSGNENLPTYIGSQATFDMKTLIRTSLETHEYYLNLGMAPEQARLFLPYAGMYTKLFWTASLSTIIRFLIQRLEDHAQYEIREVAEAVYALAEPQFQYSFAAYNL